MHSRKYVILIAISFVIIFSHFAYVHYILQDNLTISSAKENLVNAKLLSERINHEYGETGNLERLITQSKDVIQLLAYVPNDVLDEQGKQTFSKVKNASKSLKFSLETLKVDNNSIHQINEITAVLASNLDQSVTALNALLENKNNTFEIIELIITLSSIFLVVFSILFYSRPLYKDLANKNRKLINSVYQLQKRNNEVNDFSYLISHDMQEPLTTIQSVIHSNKLESQTIKNIVDKQVTKLNGLLHNLIIYNDNSKLINEYECNLKDHIQGCVHNLRLEKRVSLYIDESILLKANTSDVRLLFRNILQNSIDYQREDVPLKVHVEA